MNDNVKQPLPVHGYTEQSQAKIDLVNHNKLLEELCLRRIDELRGIGIVDARWCAMAKTHLELSFMCLNRSVFTPDRIDGELKLDVGHQTG